MKSLWDRIREWKLIKWFRELEGAQLIAVYMLLGSVVLMLFGYGNQNLGWSIWGPLDTWLRDFYANVSAEMASIAVTVLIIDAYNERRAVAREKADLILQMGSPDNGFSLEAVRKLRARGWGFGKDETLNGADLHSANLQGAYLSYANLKGADLSHAQLQHSTMQEANLQQTKVWSANMEGAHLIDADLRGMRLSKNTLLQGAILPTGEEYLADMDMGMLFGCEMEIEF